MILRDPIDMNGLFPRQSRRLRLGVVGGGRIAQTQAMAARLTDRWDVVAGALSSDPQRALKRAADWHIDPDRAYSSFQQMADSCRVIVIIEDIHAHGNGFLRAR